MLVVVSYCMSVKPTKAFKFTVRTLECIKFAQNYIAVTYLRCLLASLFAECYYYTDHSPYVLSPLPCKMQGY